eukprot:SAG31_NODE_4255_length_3414_cov_4.628959_1_plen_248_part_00
MGLGAVAFGQGVVVLYHCAAYNGLVGDDAGCRPVQKRGKPEYEFADGLADHFGSVEGFAVLGGYLASTWLLGWMPKSYYSFEGGICWPQVAGCLVCQDGLQFAMHYAEHAAPRLLPGGSAFYRASHKPHHRFTNPKLFDAFNGSVGDTVIMILIPLAATARMPGLECNVWTYMTFGSMYAAWLVLIHSETSHPWDPAFRMVGLGTPADHHVHHMKFVRNYGHLTTWFDRLAGTYRAPADVEQFNKDV